MKHLDLFSGIGGFALACEWNGIETIGFVEIDKYCQKVLRKHWLDVPIVEDIRDVKKIKEIVANATKLYEYAGNDKRAEGKTQVPKSGNRDSSGNISTTRERGTTESPAILITAGFPCQPFSIAGKRQGERDDRYLWPETIAVIKAIKPRWILLENVTGIINLALDTVLSDLEGAGYSYETLIIPACAVNAWHRRDRIWIVAHSNGDRILSWPSRNMEYDRDKSGKHCTGKREITKMVADAKRRQSGEQTEQEGREDSGRGSQEDVANTTGKGLQRQRTEHKLREVSTEAETAGRDWWAVEPELGRVAHGIPNRVDRLKCLGNAIVPQVACEIIKMIAEVENASL